VLSLSFVRLELKFVDGQGLESRGKAAPDLAPETPINPTFRIGSRDILSPLDVTNLSLKQLSFLYSLLSGSIDLLQKP
jgi:hypothetical protein